LTIPNRSVSLGSLEDDFLIKLFPEQKSVFLEEELVVDISETGSVTSREDLTTATLVNEKVSSYFLHVDPIDNGQPPKEYLGEIVFSEEILGIIIDGRSLDASDLVLGAIGTSYAPRDRYRGFEGRGFPAQAEQINDSLELMPDLRTIAVRLRTTSRLDQVRIVTRSTSTDFRTAVPEPTSIFLFATGLIFWGNCILPRKCR